MNKIKIDIMLNGGEKYYHTLTYQYNPLFKINIKDVEKFVREKCPSLINRKDVLLVFDF